MEPTLWIMPSRPVAQVGSRRLLHILRVKQDKEKIGPTGYRLAHSSGFGSAWFVNIFCVEVTSVELKLIIMVNGLVPALPHHSPSLCPYSFLAPFL
jgi:hypothetical protein